MEIEVAYATPEKQVLLKIEAPEGCTVEEAIERSEIQSEFPGMEIDPDAVGIFSRKVSLQHVLRPGDRVEIYRPLIADPKEMRKQRALEKAAKT
jgi:putative ubiquitin-RnfH superfamily antitoxin RatB of RatAB toxin-antitoxin module